MAEKRLFLLDGSSYLYRAFYAVRDLSRRDGFPTNAIFGFVNMLRKVLDNHDPDYMAVLFDAKGPTFRHDMDPAYKANRKPMPESLVPQVARIKEVVEGFNLTQMALAGYEADDLIGTLARLGREAGLSVVILSSDKDLLQLLGPQVRMFDSMKEKWLGPAEAESFWGVPPALVTQVMALCGDASDNIPGVPGIGPKTASALINEFGGLEALLTATERIKQPKRRESLETFADQARLSGRLATINCHVPLEVSMDSLRRVPPDRARLHAFFVEMEFSRLAREFEAAEPVAEEPEAPPVTSDRRHYATLTEEGDFAAFLTELAAQRIFSVDLESTGVDPVQAEIVGISISWEVGRAVYIPVAHALDAAPDGQLDRGRVLFALKPFLENPAIEKVGQNLKYEYVLFAQYGITLMGIRHDAMLYSYLLYASSRRHNLDAIALEELGRTTIHYEDVTGKGKKQIRFDQVPLELAAPYACEDAEVAWEAAHVLHRRLRALPDLDRLYREVELPLLSTLARMEAHGVLIDRAALGEMSKTLAARREILTGEIHALAGEEFNVNSTQQLGVILFEKLGIKGGKRTKSGFSTDLSVLNKLSEQGEVLPGKVLEYRQLTKLQSTYTDALAKLINPRTGRVHTSYNQAVTLTGRLSSSDPNLQNIPVRSEEGRAIRRAFVAPPGSVLLSADYSQIELRLLAHLGDVPRLKEAFARDLDIHAATASDLFGMPVEAVGPEQRRAAKTINFGLVYGMSPFGLAKRLGVGTNEARQFMDSYFRHYAGVKQYMDKAIATAKGKGYAETILGRRCPIGELGASNRNIREIAERTAINAPLQGSAADLIKVAMIRLEQALSGLQARMILQVHDELVLEVPEGEVTAVKSLVREAMEGAMGLSVPLKVDMGVGQDWAEAH